ncbi:hypothetical protein BGX34_009588 [Mortierella sp. NVP85]|nr:hypothetical protein BGX34_009588 [Mortierella sp. NVP85]
MDENRENQRSSEAEIDVEGATPSTPTLGRDVTSITDDLQLFPSPWKMPARVDEELTPRRVSSSSLGHRRSDVSTTSTSRLGQEEDTLTVEKSRILEQLRNMTTEVDQLESRLQAIKRRRARAANSALQKLRETQESEVQEMSIDVDMVEFTVREPSLDLKDVRVELPLSLQNELGGFVSRVQDESLLLPFFRTFAQYAQMNYDRQSTMNRLAMRFSHLVKLNHSMRRLSKAARSASSPDALSSTLSPAGPGVQSMVFCGSRKSSPELVLHWIIDVTDHGKIVPHVRLLPRMPKKCKAKPTVVPKELEIF